MNWKDILKIKNVVRAEQEDGCCKKIRNAVVNSPDWTYIDRNFIHSSSCDDLKTFLEGFANMEPTDEGYDFNKKASANRLLAAWAECERLSNTDPIEFDTKTQQEWA